MNYTPDDQTATVIATFSVNALTGGIFYVLFEYFRNQKDIYRSKAREKSNRTPPLPPRGLFKWLTHSLSISDEDTLRMVGMDGYLFLRFLRLCAYFCCVAGLAGALILWPVYFTSNGHMPGIAGVNLYTMGNIEQGGDRLWASVIFCWIFNLYFLWLLNDEYKTFVRLRQTYMYEGDEDIHPQKNYTVQVENIPFYFRSPTRLKKLFEDLFPGEVYSAYIGRNVTALENLVADREKLQAQLENAIAFYKGKDQQERKEVSLIKGHPVLCCGGEKTDAIDYYASEIRRLNEEIVVLKSTIVDKDNNVLSPSSSFASLSGIEHLAKGTEVPAANGTAFGIRSAASNDSDDDGYPIDLSKKKFGATSGTGFVTFKTRRAHSAAYQMHVLSDVHSSITVTQAGAPEDMIWENLNYSSKEQEGGEAVVTTIFSLGMLFWGSVLAFIAAVSNLSNLEKYLPFIKDLNPVVYSLLAGLLPVIVMNVFLSMLPAIFGYGAKNIARQKKNSDVQFEVFQWYFGYQLANVYLTLLTGSMFNALADAIANPASIIRLLAAALPSVSVFFSNYIITEILTSTTGELLQLVPMLIFNVYKRVLGERTLTQRTLLDGPLAAVEVDYGEMLPNILFVTCIVLTYMVIAPFITVLGAFYFVAFYVVMKHQFLFVYVPTFETGGRFWYGLYGFSMKGLLVSAITMIGYIAVKEGVKQAPFVLPIPFVILYVWRKTDAKYERVSKDLAYSRAVQADMDVASHAEAVESFSPSHYTQPAILTPGKLSPCRYRAGGVPLFDQKGELNEIYYEMPDGDEAEGEDEKSAVGETSSTSNGAVMNEMHNSGSSGISSTTGEEAA